MSTITSDVASQPSDQLAAVTAVHAAATRGPRASSDRLRGADRRARDQAGDHHVGALGAGAGHDGGERGAGGHRSAPSRRSSERRTPAGRSASHCAAPDDRADEQPAGRGGHGAVGRADRLDGEEAADREGEERGKPALEGHGSVSGIQMYGVRYVAITYAVRHSCQDRDRHSLQTLPPPPWLAHSRVDPRRRRGPRRAGLRSAQHARGRRPARRRADGALQPLRDQGAACRRAAGPRPRSLRAGPTTTTGSRTCAPSPARTGACWSATRGRSHRSSASPTPGSAPSASASSRSASCAAAASRRRAVAAFSGLIALNYGWASFTTARDLDPEGPARDVGAVLAQLPRRRVPADGRRRRRAGRLRQRRPLRVRARPVPRRPARDDELARAQDEQHDVVLDASPTRR